MLTHAVVGIDPGKRGGLAALDAGGLVVWADPMPLAGGEVDMVRVKLALSSLLWAHDQVTVAIEKVGAMPKQSPKSMFTFGCGYGMLRGVCSALGFPVRLVTPTTWKGQVLLGLPHDKVGAIRYCAARWPNRSLVPPGCRKPHDGVADALCIAAWMRRQA